MPPQYAENSKGCQYVMYGCYPHSIDVAANTFQKIQKELPIIENLDGFEYQVLKRHNDFSILKSTDEQPQFIVAVGLKEKMHDKFAWDASQYFSNWDNAVTCYMDGVVDKPNIMERNTNNAAPIEEDFEDEDEDEFEL